ncbi:MAG: hypothetical protein IJ438_08740 [Clostridia bacterium]|nr:hypothetical protein [Clostridia bacterium]
MKRIVSTRSLPHLFLLLALVLLCLGGTAQAETTATGTYTTEDYCWTCDKEVVFTGYYNAEKHWEICPECGDEWSSSHSVYCHAPTVCASCPATDIVYDYLEHNSWTMLHDEYYHWEACAHCHERMEVLYGHTGSCDAPTTCIYCGAQDILAQDIEHDYDAEVDQYDQTHCWTECTLCGEITWSKIEHASYCDTPAVCTYCDQTGVTISEVKHGWSSDYAWISETQCQLICDECGVAKEEPQAHVADCATPDYCKNCNTKGVIAEYSHQVDYDTWNHDATEHWRPCKNCGEKTDSYENGTHIANCGTPTVCTECKATDITAAELNHRDYSEEYDNTHHWYYCGVCHAEQWRERHEAACTSPTSCWYCDAENVDCIVWHTNVNFDDGGPNFEGPVFSDENGHWWVCPDCDDRTPYDHEYDENGICDVCDYERPPAPPRVSGDSNGDGSVNMRDALALLKKLANWDVTIDDSNSDVNGDGAVNMRDALALLKYLAGWDITLQ